MKQGPAAGMGRAGKVQRASVFLAAEAAYAL